MIEQSTKREDSTTEAQETPKTEQTFDEVEDGKALPDIDVEIDEPFMNVPDEKDPVDEPLERVKVDWEKARFDLGSNILGWCIGIMVVLVVLSMIQRDNALIASAFDTFKLIVMTILGYIFGTKSKS